MATKSIREMVEKYGRTDPEVRELMEIIDHADENLLSDEEFNEAWDRLNDLLKEKWLAEQED